MPTRHRKYDLLNRVIEAIIDDGWNVIYLGDINFHPFKIRMYKNEESHDLCIYIWNLTHGGGAQRPANEYRVQITGVSQFSRLPNEKTLILGWWNDGEVFAGFDYDKHSGVLGASPSIQIREQALRQAYTNGFSAWKKDNEEIAIGFRPDFFTEYVRNLESLHSFGESDNDFEVLEELSDNVNTVNDERVATVTNERQTTVISVKKKVRDSSFKSRVLNSYSSRCAFCGVQLKLIDAAHIVPVAHHGTDETSNGISLCALHHRAYDRRLVTFNSEYQILINEKLVTQLVNQNLHGGLQSFRDNLKAVISLPPTIADRPLVAYVSEANNLRGW